MLGLPTDEVNTVCRVFLELAYPAGEASIPKNRQIYSHLPPGKDFHEYQAETQLSPSCCLVLQKDGIIQGYSLRLGCSHFPHLKLKIQRVTAKNQPIWIYSVDTHDAFSADSLRPPPGHPDFEAWTQMQVQNAELKDKIEQAWLDLGFLTFNGLLRQELKSSAPKNEQF